MTEWVEQWICIKFFIKLEHSSEFGWFRRQQLWATGDWQLHHENVPAYASHLMQSFWRNIKSPRWLSPLQPRFGTPWLLAFPKTKITLEREEISDCWWDLEKYNRAADGNCENGVRSQGTYSEGDWGVIVQLQCFMYVVSSSINVFIFHIIWPNTFWTDFVCPRETHVYVQYDTRTRMIIAASVTIRKTWKPSKCPTLGEWENKW